MDQINIFNQKSLLLLKEHNLLKDYIYRVLLEKRIASVELNNEEKLNIKKTTISQYNIKSEEDFDDFLKNKNLSELDFYEKFGRQIKFEKISLQKHSHKVGARFLERKNELDQVIYSLIRIKDMFTAHELFLRIKEGGNFGDIAKEFSEGPENKTRGIVGPVSLNLGAPALSNQLRSSEPNKLNSPFQIGEWWLITRLESLTEATLNRDLELILSQEIMKKSLEEEADEIINSLNLSKNGNKINSETETK